MFKAPIYNSETLKMDFSQVKFREALNKRDIPLDQIKNMYLNQNMSMQMIATYFNIDVTCIMQRLHSMGIKRTKKEAAKIKISEQRSEKWLNSSRMNGKTQKEETKVKIGQRHKELWKTQEHQNNVIFGIHKEQTKYEHMLEYILEESMPNKWTYVGDSKLVIAGKNPDFIDKEFKRLIIEIGNRNGYNKSIKELEDRATLFYQNGYLTFYVWNQNLSSGKSTNKIKNEIIKWYNESIKMIETLPKINNTFWNIGA
jgi:hypothetical protein